MEYHDSDGTVPVEQHNRVGSAPVDPIDADVFAAMHQYVTHVSDIIAVLDTSRIVFANPAFADLAGYSLAELTDPNLDRFSLIHPDDREIAIAWKEDWLSGAGPADRVTIRVIRPDGTMRYVEVSANLLPGPSNRVLCVARDITERSMTELRLRRHNRLLQCANHITRVLISHRVTDAQVQKALEELVVASEVDRASVQIYRNPSSSGPCEMLLRSGGAPDSEAPQPFFSRWRDIFADGKRVAANVADLPAAEREVLAARGIVSVLALPLVVDGELRGFLRLDQLGAPRQWDDEAEVGILRLTATTLAEALAHREAETRLEESEARFRRILDQAPDIIYRMSLPDGVYEYVSAAATELLGYTPETLVANPRLIRQAMHPGWRSYFDDQWRRLLAGDVPPTYEYAIVHGKTGETRWLYQRNVLIRGANGEPVAIEGIVTDMTERRRTEIDLRSHMATLNSILRAAPIGIGVASDRVILEVNDRLCDMLGYTREELVGHSALMLYATEQDYEYVGQVGYTMMEREGVGWAETRWRRKDGTVRDVLLTSSPVVLEHSSAGVMFTALDITEQKQAEAVAAAALCEKERILVESQSRVRNNLTLVSSLLGLQVLHLDNPALEAPFSETRDRVHAMARLYEHLYRSPDAAEVPMYAYTVQLIDDLHLAYGTDAAIEVKASDLRLPVDLAMSCGLILNELVTNAFKHAFPDTETGVSQPRVEVTLARHGEQVILVVCDNSKGPQARSNLEGSVGWSLVRMLTQQLEGELLVENRGGTRLSVRFPYAGSSIP